VALQSVGQGSDTTYVAVPHVCREQLNTINHSGSTIAANVVVYIDTVHYGALDRDTARSRWESAERHDSHIDHPRLDRRLRSDAIGHGGDFPVD
jgi:hypothetical protein